MKVVESFDPAQYQDKIVEEFSVCPSIFNLFKYSNMGGSSEVTCFLKEEPKPRTLFVPEQTQQGLPSSHKNTGMQYLFTKVSSRSDGEPDYWLITCSFSLCGYLLPIEVFQEGEVLISAPKLEPLDMFA